jgi:N-acetylglucosaminyl-diphospho-decaprenol L-rhamnosyltransferase
MSAPTTSTMTENEPLALQETSGQPDVSVLVVNYNTERLLTPMWDALMTARRNLQLQVIVVDNASRDGSVNLLRADPRFASADLIINQTNVGFGRANNQCVPTAQGRYLLLLNTDAFVSPETLQTTVAFMDAHPKHGVLGVQLIGSDGKAQPSCRYFPTPWNQFLARSGFSRFFPSVKMVDDLDWDHGSPRECDWVTGCYFLIRREVVDSVGLFDPRYFLYCEEVDLCRRVKQAGWGVVFFNGTKVIHLGGESAKSEGPLTPGGQQISALQIESEMLYFRKHNGIKGVVTYVLLAWLSDFIDASKGLIKGRGLLGLKVIGQNARAVGSTLFKTRLGTTPTR